MTTTKHIDTGEAARRLGISRRGVQQQIKRGLLPAAKFGRDYMIDPADLALVRGLKPGPEPKNKSKIPKNSS